MTAEDCFSRTQSLPQPPKYPGKFSPSEMFIIAPCSSKLIPLHISPKNWFLVMQLWIAIELKLALLWVEIIRPDFIDLVTCLFFENLRNKISYTDHKQVSILCLWNRTLGSDNEFNLSFLSSHHLVLQAKKSTQSSGRKREQRQLPNLQNVKIVRADLLFLRQQDVRTISV